MYGVLARRRARVLSEDVLEGTQTFVVTALLPVVRSKMGGRRGNAVGR
jgi:translation elongation factor EF-G